MRTKEMSISNCTHSHTYINTHLYNNKCVRSFLFKNTPILLIYKTFAYMVNVKYFQVLMKIDLLECKNSFYLMHPLRYSI